MSCPCRYPSRCRSPWPPLMRAIRISLAGGAFLGFCPSDYRRKQAPNCVGGDCLGKKSNKAGIANALRPICWRCCHYPDCNAFPKKLGTRHVRLTEGIPYNAGGPSKDVLAGNTALGSLWNPIRFIWIETKYLFPRCQGRENSFTFIENGAEVTIEALLRRQTHCAPKGNSAS